MLISNIEHELLRNHLGHGQRYGVRIEYSVAEKIGTTGGLGEAGPILGDRFLIYYGDVLTDMDLRAMIRFHNSKNTVCTVALSRAATIEYGVARVTEDSRITYFKEKPLLQEYPVSMGVYMLQKEALNYCQPNTDLS